MKKYLLIILLFITSCDPLYEVTYSFFNNTNFDISIILYDKGFSPDTFNLSTFNYDTLSNSVTLSIPEKIYKEFDSAIIVSTINKVIKYYPSDTLKEGKSFFKEKYWTIENPSKRVYIYTFEINDDDFK